MWTNWKKDLKEIAGGITAVAHAAWELGTDWWDISSAKQKWVVVIVGAIVLLSLSRCASAATADSNYGVWYSEAQPGISYICHMEQGVEVTGEIMTCLVGVIIGPGAHMVEGDVIHCAVTGMKKFEGEMKPSIECDGYEALQSKLRGV